MGKSQDNRHGGWTIQQSIAMELDVALTAFGGGSFFFKNEELTRMIQSAPTDWRTQWPQMLGERRSSVSVLEYAASMADVLLDGNYEQTTLTIRELTVVDALAHVEQQAVLFDLQANPALSLPERLIDLEQRLVTAEYSNVGFDITQQIVHLQNHEIEWAVRILRGGDLHARFWFWLDRFYFEIYRPWREQQRELMENLRKRAQVELGSVAQQRKPPNLSWLSAQNPVLRLAQLHTAVTKGRLKVCFWVDPFELFDSWALMPGLLIVSFAEPGTLLQSVTTQISNLAERTDALSDPTRLMILRMIRHFGMINTEIADYLQLARPTVSVHAKILREAGLIRSHQEGRLVRHEIVPAEVRKLFLDLEHFLDLPADEPEH